MLDKKKAMRKIRKKKSGRDHFFPRTEKEKLEAIMRVCKSLADMYKSVKIEEQEK